MANKGLWFRGDDSVIDIIGLCKKENEVRKNYMLMLLAFVVSLPASAIDDDKLEDHTNCVNNCVEDHSGQSQKDKDDYNSCVNTCHGDAWGTNGNEHGSDKVVQDERAPGMSGCLRRIPSKDIIVIEDKGTTPADEFDQPTQDIDIEKRPYHFCFDNDREAYRRRLQRGVTNPRGCDGFIDYRTFSTVPPIPPSHFNPEFYDWRTGRFFPLSDPTVINRLRDRSDFY